MKIFHVAVAIILAGGLCVAQPAKADEIVSSVGNTSSGFTDGQAVSSALFASTNGTQLAPFNAACGSDSGTAGSTTCSASWTFGYVVPAGDTITGATLTLGIVDLDSKAAGNQIAAFNVSGTNDLTGLLNAVSEGLNGATGSINNQYNVLTISIPGADLAALSGSSATFSLALAAPGLGALGSSPSNGADLVFSTLDITATPGSTTPPPPVPEPSTSMLLVLGLALLATKTALNKLS
jgi:hypothetical protein